MSDKREWLPDLRWLRHLRCLVPGQVAKAVAMMDMFRTLKYDPHLQMEEHGTDNVSEVEGEKGMGVPYIAVD